MTAVRELMHSGLITCAPGAKLAEVAAILRANRVHAVVVSDGKKGALGIVSDTDLLAGEWLGDNADNVAILGRMTAAELMTQPVATIASSSTAKEAAAEIRRLHVARLLVTEDSEPIGVISISDLLAAMPIGPAHREHVSDVMSWGYVACRPNTPVSGAVRAMLERDSRSLMVVNKGGKLVGVVTGFDLLGSFGSKSSGAHTVAEFMNPPITIAPDASLHDAVNLMLDKTIHRLAVVDPEDPGGPPLGTISTTDIMIEMTSPKSDWRQ